MAATSSVPELGLNNILMLSRYHQLCEKWNMHHTKCFLESWIFLFAPQNRQCGYTVTVWILNQWKRNHSSLSQQPFLLAAAPCSTSLIHFSPGGPQRIQSKTVMRHQTKVIHNSRLYHLVWDSPELWFILLLKWLFVLEQRLLGNYFYSSLPMSGVGMFSLQKSRIRFLSKAMHWAGAK